MDKEAGYCDALAGMMNGVPFHVHVIERAQLCDDVDVNIWDIDKDGRDKKGTTLKTG